MKGHGQGWRLRPARSHCAVFFSRTLYSHSDSPLPRVQMGTGELLDKSDLSGGGWCVVRHQTRLLSSVISLRKSLLCFVWQGAVARSILTMFVLFCLEISFIVNY